MHAYERSYRDYFHTLHLSESNTCGATALCAAKGEGWRGKDVLNFEANGGESCCEFLLRKVAGGDKKDCVLFDELGDGLGVKIDGEGAVDGLGGEGDGVEGALVADEVPAVVLRAQGGLGKGEEGGDGSGIEEVCRGEVDVGARAGALGGDGLGELDRGGRIINADEACGI